MDSHSDSDSGALLGCEGDSINKLKAMRGGRNVDNISDTWLACYAVKNNSVGPYASMKDFHDYHAKTQTP